ncbi:MAG: hypothetical protein KGI02_09285 [Thaumarchaeota archaeon]|nr:hypothetical protein [Nitrososphaerota archaeon]
MKVLSFAISIILISISLSQINAVLAQEQKTPQQISPPPPDTVGCYHWTKETGWEPVQCMSQTDIKKLGQSQPNRFSLPPQNDMNDSWQGLLVFGGIIGAVSCAVSVFVLRYKSAESRIN